MKVSKWWSQTEMSFNPFWLVWAGLAIYLCVSGIVSWWIPILIFVAQIEFQWTFKRKLNA